MGLLSYIAIKGIETAAKKTTIKALESAAVNVIVATNKNQDNKDDTIIKNGKLFIKPTRPSEDYIDKDALEIAKELLGAGFESVEMQPVKSLGERHINRYGKIHSISINGKSDFLGVKKVPSSAYILIEYLDFKNKIDKDIYQRVKYINPGLIRANNSSVLSDNVMEFAAKKFCCYCGQEVKNNGAKFCAACGKEL